MIESLLRVRSLLTAIFALMVGSGFLTTLVSLRLERAGSGTLMIGLVSTAYFAGLSIGALRVAPVVHRVGHIRVFAAVVSLFSASTLAYGLFEDAWLWACLRFVDGLCVAGVFVCLESWLNEKADARTRGSILAGYMVALYLGQALGQFLLNLDVQQPAVLFMVASLVISLASIPVLLTRIAAPAPGEAQPFNMARLYAASPLGAVGAAMTGMMLGAFYGLAAVHVRRLGLDLAATALFMSTVIAGGVALQWPLGRLSDRFDRRVVIVGTFAGAALCSLALVFITGTGAPLLLAGAIFGGASFALYPLCVAHTNDHLDDSTRVAATGGLVLLYSIGAVLGPIGGALAMTIAGSQGLFLFIAALAAGMFLFGIWRQAASAPVPAPLQGDYQLLPRTTPVVAMLDPQAADPDDTAQEQS